MFRGLIYGGVVVFVVLGVEVKECPVMSGVDFDGLGWFDRRPGDGEREPVGAGLKLGGWRGGFHGVRSLAG